MPAEQFAELRALVDEIGTLVGAGELFHKIGDSAGADATAEAIATRLAQLANLTADLLGNDRPYDATDLA